MLITTGFQYVFFSPYATGNHHDGVPNTTFPTHTVLKKIYSHWVCCVQGEHAPALFVMLYSCRSWLYSKVQIISEVKQRPHIVIPLESGSKQGEEACLSQRLGLRGVYQLPVLHISVQHEVHPLLLNHNIYPPV